MNRKSYKKKNDYGQKLFKVLFIVMLLLSILSLCIAIINFDSENFVLLFALSLFLMLNSFVFKFFESVIELLKKQDWYSKQFKIKKLRFLEGL